MADEFNRLDWYMPRERTIIPLDNYNIPRSLRQFLKKSKFNFSFDSDQMGVIKECAAREETWISDELIKAYYNLYKLGHIHSVEIFEQDKMVGGLYGVTVNGAFFGESMFSRVSQASKAALAILLKYLESSGFLLLDVQFPTDHLGMFGAVTIPFKEYKKILSEALKISTTFGVNRE